MSDLGNRTRSGSASTHRRRARGWNLRSVMYMPRRKVRTDSTSMKAPIVPSMTT